MVFTTLCRYAEFAIPPLPAEINVLGLDLSQIWTLLGDMFAFLVRSSCGWTTRAKRTLVKDLLLVASLLLVAMPGAPSSILAPSSI